MEAIGKFGGRLTALVLQLSAAGLLVGLLVKALFEVDNHFDSWWYHLPWAARLAGLMSPDEYLFEPLAAARFEGFPVLPELLQGLLWRATGRVESANLVGFLSLAAYIFFLRRYLGVAWWLATPALLAVPLVQAHATVAYVDLIANLAMAALLLLTFLAYVRTGFVRRETLALLLFTAFVAANSKLQLIPLVALALMFAAYPFSVWLSSPDKGKQPGSTAKVLRLTVIALAMGAIFFVPLKNLVQHGNPVYPLKLEIAGVVLNHQEQLPPEDMGTGTLTDSPQAVKWFYSVFEVGMSPLFDVKRWTLDSSAPPGAPMTIQGGYFNLYVVAQLILLLYLLTRVGRKERRAALVLVGVASAVTMVMPASHLLRYYMYWMICIISLNLYFLAALNAEWMRRIAASVFLLFVLMVVDITDQNFVRPRFYSLDQFLTERIDPRILRDVKSGGPVCLAMADVSRHFLYAPLWHPPANYTVKAGPFHAADEAEVQATCAGRRIIR